MRKKPGKYFTCKICKKIFYRSPYRMNGKYLACSVKCHSKLPKPFMKESNNNNWKGGRILIHGYIFILNPHRKPFKIQKGLSRYISEQRYIFEQHIGRKLKSNEIIHHKNHKKLDNRIENLQLINRAKHLKIHEPPLEAVIQRNRKAAHIRWSK